MNMKKIVNDYIDDLENKAKSSDKYFMERNKLYIEKEQMKDILRQWKEMSSVSVFELNNLLDKLYNIVFKPDIVQKEEQE